MDPEQQDAAITVETETQYANVNIQARSVKYSYKSLYSFLVVDAYFAQVHGRVSI